MGEDERMWLKVDDGFPDHPKVLQCSNSTIGVWTKLGSWCAKHLTDGRFSLESISQYDPEGEALGELLSSGLAEEHPEGGYQLHDFTDYNRSAADQKSLIEKRKKGGLARAQQVQSTCSAQGTGTGERSRKVSMPPDWMPNATAAARAAALKLDLADEADDFREWTTAKDMKYVGLRGWDAGFLNHLRSQDKRNRERSQNNGGRRSEQAWARTKAEEQQSPPYHKPFPPDEDDDG